MDTLTNEGEIWSENKHQHAPCITTTVQVLAVTKATTPYTNNTNHANRTTTVCRTNINMHHVCITTTVQVLAVTK